MPFKRIAAEVGMSVATAHLWTRDSELTPEQIDHNLCGATGPQNPERVAARAAAWRARNRARRAAYQVEGREYAHRRDPLHLAGCMLYWAEGSKRRNCARPCNSDLHMMRFFRRFVTTCFDVRAEDMTLALNVYLGNGLTISQIERYWLDALALPESCLRKHSVNSLPTSSSGKRQNRLPYGVATLTVHSTRIVQHIYGAIQEYGGFEQPGWID